MGASLGLYEHEGLLLQSPRLALAPPINGASYREIMADELVRLEVLQGLLFGLFKGDKDRAPLKGI